MKPDHHTLHIVIRRFLFVVIAFSLVFVTPVTAGDMDAGYEPPPYRPSAGEMVVDGLIVRPLSLAGTIIGTGLFIVTLPFSLTGGNVEDAGQRLVADPARATFGQCLGCMPYYRSPHPRERYREYYEDY